MVFFLFFSFFFWRGGWGKFRCSVCSWDLQWEVNIKPDRNNGGKSALVVTDKPLCFSRSRLSLILFSLSKNTEYFPGISTVYKNNNQICYNIKYHAITNVQRCTHSEKLNESEFKFLLYNLALIVYLLRAPLKNTFRIHLNRFTHLYHI